MHRLGQGFKIGLNKNGSKLKETKKNYLVINTLFGVLHATRFVTLDTFLKGVLMHFKNLSVS